MRLLWQRYWLMMLFYWDCFFLCSSFQHHIALDCLPNNLLTLTVWSQIPPDLFFGVLLFQLTAKHLHRATSDFFFKYSNWVIFILYEKILSIHFLHLKFGPDFLPYHRGLVSVTLALFSTTPATPPPRIPHATQILSSFACEPAGRLSALRLLPCMF